MKNKILFQLAFLVLAFTAFAQNQGFYLQKGLFNKGNRATLQKDKIWYATIPKLSDVGKSFYQFGSIDSNFNLVNQVVGTLTTPDSEFAFFETLDDENIMVGIHFWDCDAAKLRGKIGVVNTKNLSYTQVSPKPNASTLSNFQLCLVGKKAVSEGKIYDFENKTESNFAINFPAGEYSAALFGSGKNLFIFTNKSNWYSSDLANQTPTLLGKIPFQKYPRSNNPFAVINDKKIVYADDKNLYLIDFQKDSSKSIATSTPYLRLKYFEKEQHLWASSKDKIDIYDAQLNLIKTEALQNIYPTSVDDFFIKNEKIYCVGNIIIPPLASNLQSTGGSVTYIAPLKSQKISQDVALQNIDFQFEKPIGTKASTTGWPIYNLDFGEAKVRVKNNGTENIKSININFGHQADDYLFFLGCDPDIYNVWRFDSLDILPNQEFTLTLPKVILKSQISNQNEKMCLWISLVNDAFDNEPSNNYFCKKYDITTATFDEKNNLPISVFPNPTSDEINIQSENLPLKKVEIFDFLGKTVYSKKYDNQSVIKENIAFLPKGIYTIIVDSEKGKLMKKLVVDK